jgi:hypothetical protein
MTRQAVFRFYAELNDLLPRGRREASLALAFNAGQSLKHLVESLGVPHTEVGRAAVNGKGVDLGYLVHDGDQVELFPGAPELPANDRRFILDNHLGRLAAALRMLGLTACTATITRTPSWRRFPASRGGFCSPAISAC